LHLCVCVCLSVCLSTCIGLAFQLLKQLPYIFSALTAFFKTTITDPLRQEYISINVKILTSTCCSVVTKHAENLALAFQL
jgi:hypothetical protein